MRRTALLCFLLLFSIAGRAIAVEGMWQPQQLSELKDRLKTSGLELDLDDLTLYYPARYCRKIHWSRPF